MAVALVGQPRRYRRLVASFLTTLSCVSLLAVGSRVGARGISDARLLPAPSAAGGSRFLTMSYFTTGPTLPVQIVPGTPTYYVPSASSGHIVLRRANGSIVTQGLLTTSSSRPEAMLVLPGPETFAGTMEFSGDDQLARFSQAVLIDARPSNSVDVNSPYMGRLVVSWLRYLVYDHVTTTVVVAGSTYVPTSVDVIAGTATFDVPTDSVGELRFEATYASSANGNPATWIDRTRRTVWANGLATPVVSLQIGTYLTQSPWYASVYVSHQAVLPPGTTVSLDLDGITQASGSPNAGGVIAPLPPGHHVVTATLRSAGPYDMTKVEELDVDVAPDSWIDWRADVNTLSAIVRRGSYYSAPRGTFHLDTPMVVGDVTPSNTFSQYSLQGVLTDGHYRISWTAAPDTAAVVVDPVEFWVVDGRVTTSQPPPLAGGKITVFYERNDAPTNGDPGNTVDTSCTRVDGTSRYWWSTFIYFGSLLTLRDTTIGGATCQIAVGHGTGLVKVYMTIGGLDAVDTSRTTNNVTWSRRFAVDEGATVPVIIAVNRAELGVKVFSSGDSTTYPVTGTIEITCRTPTGTIIDQPIQRSFTSSMNTSFGWNQFPHLTRNDRCTVQLISSTTATEVTYQTTIDGVNTDTDGPMSLPTPPGGSVYVQLNWAGDLVLGLDPESPISPATLSYYCDKGGPKSAVTLARGEQRVIHSVSAGTNCLVIYDTPSTPYRATFVDTSGDTTDGRISVYLRPPGSPKPVSDDGTLVADPCAVHVTATLTRTGPAPRQAASVGEPVPIVPRSDPPSSPPATPQPRTAAPVA